MPGKLQTCRTLFLVSGIINALACLIWLFSASSIALLTCGLGCVLYAAPILNIISCVFDFMAYARFNNLSYPGTENLLRNSAIIEIVTILTSNGISMIIGIINLVFLNDVEVKKYFEALRGNSAKV